MINSDPSTSIVQIWNTQQTQIVGTGFVIGPELIATCAHVVDSARSDLGGKVNIVFEQGNHPAEAEVSVYLPANQGDIAILRLSATLPQGITPLALSEAAGCGGHDFQAFGYVPLGDVRGVWASGAIKGVVRLTGGRRLIQLSSPEIDQGLSGGPVFDLARQKVVGMVTEVYRTDRWGKHRDTSLATLADDLHRACPTIPLHPAPLEELLIAGGRPRYSRLLERDIRLALFTRGWAFVRQMMMRRPLQMALGLLFPLIVGAWGIYTYQHWGWQRVEGGQAYLGAADNFCACAVAPFEVQFTEVTNADYDRCVQVKKCTPPSVWPTGPQGQKYEAGQDQFPVFGLTWEQANTYCQSIGARLPTEVEWMRAARAGNQWDYAWGNDPNTDKANVLDSHKGWPVPVTSYSKTLGPYGLYNVVGNVREWVNGSAINCPCHTPESFSVAKGGSYIDPFNRATLWERIESSDPEHPVNYTGVRCAR